MRIHIPFFTGERPKLTPELLEDHQATLAVNCRLDSGALSPWRAPKSAANLGAPGVRRSIRLLGGAFWLSWPGEVELARLPLAGDAVERTVITGLDAPRVTDASLAAQAQPTGRAPASTLLGVPAPQKTPQAAPGSGGAGEERSLAYVVTFVTSRGEEGPPSPPTPVIQARPGQAVDLYNFDPVPAGDYEIDRRRIYRTATPESGSALWLFAAEIDAHESSYTDTAADDDLGEALPSAQWYGPPSGLRGVVSLPNGFLAGYAGNELCFSEPWRPHAWPPGYRLTTDSPIRGLGVFGTTLVVPTADRPYLVTGSHPAQMSMARLPERQPCLSGRGVASGEPGVAYPSPDGLYVVGPRGGRLLTREALGRETWQGFNPAAMHARMHDGRYHAFYEFEPEKVWGWEDTGLTRLAGGLNEALLCGRRVNGSLLDRVEYAPPETRGAGLVLDCTTDPPQVTRLDFYAHAMTRDPATDQLYLSLEGEDAATVAAWDAGEERLDVVWRSRPFRAPAPLSLAAARVELEGGRGEQVRFTLWADGVRRVVREVKSDDPFRLPGGFRARVWQVELAGSATVKAVTLATSKAALAG